MWKCEANENIVGIELVGIFAKLEEESQILHVQFLCKLGWSYHGHWHSQGYHVQVQTQKILQKIAKINDLP